MNDRRNFLTACLSGAAWLMGWKPKQRVRYIAYSMNEPFALPGDPLLPAIGSPYFTTMTMNEWRSKPCES